MTDSAHGQPLFADVSLLPGQVVARCIVVTYMGPPAQLMFGASGSGTLLASLEVTAEVGTLLPSTPAGECNGFVANRTIYQGSLSTAQDVPFASVGEGTTVVAFRIAVMLAGHAVPGSTSSVNFYWDATASSA
jgi:hypothetical protein